MEHTLNHGMCRCCASEGMFKNFTATYQWMGADEVYADMLKECFDVSLTTAEDYNNGGICEVCITQLRNASNFKKQVLQTEEQFKKALQDDIFKSSIVKEEVNKEDGDFDSDNNISEDFSGTEFEVPIKEENVEPKAKKRSAKASTSSAKRAKKEDGEPSNKRHRRHVVNFENLDISLDSIKKEKNILKLGETSNAEDNLVNEIEMVDKKLKRKREFYRTPGQAENRVNLKGILQYSNATPIRSRGDVGYECCFCDEQFPDPLDLKCHTMETHDYKTMFLMLKEKRMYSLKMDITGLHCQICFENMHDLEELVDHLVDSHQEPLHKNVKSFILPLKFDSDILQCYICSETFTNFKRLIEHIHKHSRNFVCDICDAGFVNRDILRNHRKTHDIGLYQCQLCCKIFDTYVKMKSHERAVHKRNGTLNKCGIFNEKFKGHFKKILHLSEAHGIEPTVLNCNACDRNFIHRSALRVHIQKYHMLERRYCCTECEMKFFSKFELDKHMVKHTGQKDFQCQICLKSYGRKTTLKEHMKIHENDRRFKCAHCGMSFVQRCSWRGHMRAKHGEIV